MGRGALSKYEKTKIIQGLRKKQSTLEIAKMLGRDHRKIKKYATNPDKGKIREKSGVSRPVIRLLLAHSKQLVCLMFAKAHDVQS